MSTEITLRRDTAANWTSNNPTLAAGEIGIESDTGLRKSGDGSTAWTSLKYLPASITDMWGFPSIDYDEDNTVPQRDTVPSSALGNISTWQIANGVNTVLVGELRSVPIGWTTADLHIILVTVNTTASGNVRMSAFMQKLSAALAYSAEGPGATNYSVTGGASGTFTDVTLASGLTVPADGWWAPRAYFERGNAGDTFGSVINVVGYYLERAS